MLPERMFILERPNGALMSRSRQLQLSVYVKIVNHLRHRVQKLMWFPLIDTLICFHIL